MNTPTLTHDIYQDVVEDTRGKTLTETADQVDDKAQRLQELSDSIGNEIKDAVPEIKDPQEGIKDTLDDLSDETRNSVEQAMKASKEEQAETLRETAKQLKEGAKDLRKATDGVDVRNEEHEGNTLGMARLGEAGSASADAGKVIGKGDKLIDADMTKGVVIHEKEHTEQEAQDIGQVSVGKTASSTQGAPKASPRTLEESVGKSDTVTSLELTEAAAIAAQIKEAPKSFDTLADSYKAAYKKVLAHAGSSERIVELGRRSTGLRELAKQANATEAQHTMAV